MDTGGSTTDPNSVVPAPEDNTPPDSGSTDPGGNGATTPPKHKSGKKPKEPHKRHPRPRRVPGHGVKSRNHKGHVTHHGGSTKRKPSTKGTHSRRLIPKATAGGELRGHPPIHAKKAKHTVKAIPTAPIVTKTGEVRGTPRVVKKSSKVRHR